MIYCFRDLVNNTTVYVCPDQQAIEAGKTEGYEGVFLVGSQSDAQNLIAPSRDKWVAENTDLVSVNESVVVEGGVQWVKCDLALEPENTDGVYEVFNIINGSYTGAVGLANAKEVLIEKQTNAFFHFNPIFEMETWPPKPKVSLSTGTQTI